MVFLHLSRGKYPPGYVHGADSLRREGMRPEGHDVLRGLLLDGASANSIKMLPLFNMGWFNREPEIIPIEPDLGNASEGSMNMSGKNDSRITDQPSPSPGDGCFRRKVLHALEDVVFRNGRVAGLVINCAPVEAASLHADPLTLHSAFALDATGHPANAADTLVRKGQKAAREMLGELGS